ncbi:ATP-binding domain-containing protein [Herbaspirillum sp. SJZ107]|uniref:ATP-binding domain-containing protein n=1 Tax=Herbaspirillum sp. SJZ107 TaxID=2572881 RepID=UPI0011669E29|nr:ATP-binding domain-containing protein [Herbaspirillum sp. SJZ107]TQK03435.1 UvrD-like helicase family protein [Herbaspirillum sp. SJZ107]
MRLPKLRDLTEAQRSVYLYAPKDAHVLVQGPPGTGKTLIAWLRAIGLQKLGQPVALCMFNRVLMKYASNVDGAQETQLRVTTARQWFLDWWLRAAIPPCKQGGDVLVNAPKEDKDAVKAAGARWHFRTWNPWTGRPGVWAVACEEWETRASGLAAWPRWQAPPEHPESKQEYDWDAIRDRVIQHSGAFGEDVLSLGTLLIDEGQDFHAGFYRFLNIVSVIGSSMKVKHPLRCFVLADENQQLTQFNSTLEDIRQGLGIAEDCRFSLVDNFRNTLQIAELAASFHAGIGAIPVMPQRTGEVPLFVECRTIAACVGRVVTWITNHPGKEVGVLVFREPKRQEMHERLAAEVASIRGRNITVQSYSWESRADNPSDSLVFDQGDVVTVLNMSSCKGLEFDAVFIVDPHDCAIANLGADRFRMQMFVAASRAREWVEILESAPVRTDALFLQEFPSEELLVRDAPRQKPVAARVVQNVPPARATSPAAAVANWAAQAEVLARKHGFAFEDLRPKGCVWVNAPESFSKPMEKLGFRYASRRNAWWRLQ